MDNDETKNEGLILYFTMQAAELTGVPRLCTIAGCRRDRRCGMKDFLNDEPFCMSLVSERQRRRIADIVAESMIVSSALRDGRTYHLEPHGRRRGVQDDALRLMSGMYTTAEDPPAFWRRIRRRYVKSPARLATGGQARPAAR